MTKTVVVPQIKTVVQQGVFQQVQQVQQAAPAVQQAAPAVQQAAPAAAVTSMATFTG